MCPATGQWPQMSVTRDMSGMGPMAVVVYKWLAGMIADRSNRQCSTTMRMLRCWISLDLLSDAYPRQSFRPRKLVTHHCLQTSDLSHWPAAWESIPQNHCKPPGKIPITKTSVTHQFKKASSVEPMVQWNIHLTRVLYWKRPEPTVPIFATFLDLKNAFGFVPHALIVDMFLHIRQPLEVTSYACGQLVFQGPSCYVN